MDWGCKQRKNRGIYQEQNREKTKYEAVESLWFFQGKQKGGFFLGVSRKREMRERLRFGEC